jgi:hypothetical protein
MLKKKKKLTVSFQNHSSPTRPARIFTGRSPVHRTEQEPRDADSPRRPNQKEKHLDDEHRTRLHRAKITSIPHRTQNTRRTDQRMHHARWDPEHPTISSLEIVDADQQQTCRTTTTLKKTPKKSPFGSSHHAQNLWTEPNKISDSTRLWIAEQVREKPVLLTEGVRVLASRATHGTTLHKNYCTHDNAWLRKVHGYRGGARIQDLGG